MRRACGIICALLFFLIASSVAMATECSCWNDDERRQVEGFSEMEGAIVLSFKDAVSCEPISGAHVNLTLPDKTRHLKTGAKGYIVMPEAVVDAMEEGTIDVALTKEGYIPFEAKIPVMAGTIRYKRFLLSKDIPLTSVRFVLQWEESPKDLDLHLVKDDTLHISYRHMRSIPDLARLDRDDRDGLGPETLTLDRIDNASTYRLIAHNYSGEASLEGGRVTVYANGHLDRVIPLGDAKGREADVLWIRDGKMVVQ